MTTQENLIKYQEEIKSVVAYGARIGFDFKNGDIKDLMNGWINYTNKLHINIMENREEVMRIVKSKL
jgi:hypothetical protein